MRRCGRAANRQPTASNVNLNRATDVVPNAVISSIGTGGKVCIFTLVGMDVIADVSGYAPAGAQYNSLTPARLLDTRASGRRSTSLFEGDGSDPGRRRAVSSRWAAVAACPRAPSRWRSTSRSRVRRASASSRCGRAARSVRSARTSTTPGRHHGQPRDARRRDRRQGLLLQPGTDRSGRRRVGLLPGLSL